MSSVYFVVGLGFFMLAALTMSFVSFMVGLVFFILAIDAQKRRSTSARDTSTKGTDISVQVLVLGDIGRSPRMQYHALSIAEHGGRVDLIGYQESPLLDELAQHDLVTVVPLTPPPQSIRSLPFIVSGPLKVVWQVYDLFRTLAWDTKPATWLLVQNPPSIPTLAVAALVAALRRTSLLIDWHNYGWTILAGTRGASHPFVAVAKIYETVWGRAGNANLTVTEAMARQLRRAPYSITSPVAVLHDRPADLFRPISSPSNRLHLLSKILRSREQAAAIVEGRTRLLVSSTSWTPDEDFQLLLDALVRYRTSPTQGRPPLLAIITGKGPQKTMYEARVAQLRRDGQLDDVEIRTAFLPMEDYASLLGCADLGVCLHRSSSGVDLPMKVVDMFGAGLPVLAFSDYESFDELVRDGDNGRGFVTADELSVHLSWLLARAGESELKALKEGAVRESARRWPAEWDRVVAPILGFEAG